MIGGVAAGVRHACGRSRAARDAVRSPAGRAVAAAHIEEVLIDDIPSQTSQTPVIPMNRDAGLAAEPLTAPPWRAAGLFSDHYLSTRLPASGAPVWPAEAEARAAFEALGGLWRQWSGRLATASEEDCEDYFIGPALRALGYGHLPRRQLPGAGRRQYPDFLLFDSQDRADTAFAGGGDPYAASLAILEAKKWALSLDVPRGREKSPHQQTRDYLADAPEGLTWALLSSGREWRLYHRHDRASTFFAFDLGPVLGVPDGDAGAAAEAFGRFRVFHALFRRAALAPDGAGMRAVDLARAGALAFKEEVERDLRAQVFACVELLGHGFLTRVQNQLGERDLPAIYENALVLLYRLLFVLNAEARGLLPTEPRDAASDEFYHAFGLAKVRHELAAPGGGRYASDYTTGLLDRLRGLFALINGVQVSTVGPDKNEALGIPRYNGGLFDPARYPLLERWSIADRELAEVIQRLAFRVEKDGARSTIDYLTLGERHLGSIYEGLLEHRLALAADGGGLAVRLVNDKGERKTAGAYYTPQAWVSYIVEGTLRPILERLADEVGTPAAGVEPDDRFGEAVLGLNVCDPAMGSGHFLVEAVAVLADAVAGHVSTRPRPAYDTHGLPMGEATDGSTLTYWRRRVVEACIYGVDLNPLAVELAKLSLWLQTVDRIPLSFLDHHLRAGNSLIGARLADLASLPAPGKGGARADGDGAPRGKAMRQRGAATYAAVVQLPLTFSADLAQAVGAAIGGILRIEGVATESLSGAKEKEGLWRRIAGETLAPFRAVADLWLARWFGVDLEEDVYRAALDGQAQAPGIRESRAPGLARRRFFHWELEFPDIFFDERGRRRADGGFDAVVGNPPWEQLELAENEFFAVRRPEIALAATGSKRKALIAALPTTDPDLWQEFQDALGAVNAERRFLQQSGIYPLCGRGRTNLYAVFAERALDLVAPAGRVGLLVPSGIATDHTTRHFFQKLVDERRLAELLDFENRRKVFEDVDSRFKFSIMLMTGAGDPRDHVRAGFFLHGMGDVDDPERIFELRPDDFTLFNPNTRTCPIFRRRRDYELTRKIYERVPVLVDRAKGEMGNPWGASFKQGLFNMTSDSHLFRTAMELEAAGFWLGVGNVFTKGAERYLPLYEAKMIHQFDHRYASGVAGDERLISSQASDVATIDQKANADFSIMPRYWVPSESVPTDQYILLGFRDIARATDVRTCIASVIPRSGVGHTLPLIKTGTPSAYRAFLLANLNTIVFDFVVRQKISSTHMTFFIVEQLPILPPNTYDADFHGARLADFITPRVLELCYTAHDLKGLADDLGYDGPPFAWDPERRLHLRCQLDALYFILYGLSRDEAAEVLDTFPIVKRQDEAAFGRFRTKDLILAYYNALAAGNLDAWVKG